MAHLSRDWAIDLRGPFAQPLGQASSEPSGLIRKPVLDLRRAELVDQCFGQKGVHEGLLCVASSDAGLRLRARVDLDLIQLDRFRNLIDTVQPKLATVSRVARVTLQTIADELGVSRTTVSNAFSKPNELSDELRERILETARRLGYAGPDPAARSLRRGKAGALGLILKESLGYAFTDPYALDFLSGLAPATEQARLGLLLIPCPPGTNVVEGVQEAVVDTFCVFSLPDEHPVAEAVLERNLPSVFVDGPRPPGQAFVGIDDRAAMAEMALHLVDLGHRKVLIVTFRVVGDDYVGVIDRGRLQHSEYRVTRDRLIGALEILDGAGVEAVIYEVGLNDREGAHRMALELLAAPDRPTAVLCASDQLALGVLDALPELGLQAPADISVSGFDDIDGADAVGLTTVNQSAAEKGRVAAEILASGEVKTVILEHRLMIRGTTGPAPD